jgi:hypothetical protein
VPTAGKGRQRPAHFRRFFTSALHVVGAPVDSYPWRTGTAMLSGQVVIDGSMARLSGWRAETCMEMARAWRVLRATAADKGEQGSGMGGTWRRLPAERCRVVSRRWCAVDALPWRERTRYAWRDLAGGLGHLQCSSGSGLFTLFPIF